MNFTITTYPVQAQLGHLPLPEELLTLIKDFVFFNADDFYQRISGAVAAKSLISYIIKQSHSRRLEEQEEDVRLAYVDCHIFTCPEPEKWIFANFVQTIYDPNIFYPYGATRQPFNYFTATNCSACGNYSASHCKPLPFKLWCKCTDSASYGLDQLFLEDASA